MKKNFLNTFLVCLFLLVGNSLVYADNIPPTTPVWNTTFGPSIVFSNTEIAIYWNSSTSSVGLAGYYIYRCMGANCTLPSNPTFNVTVPTTTFYGDATLSAGTNYSYAIAAYDTAGDISAQSSIITATTKGTLSNIVPVIGLLSPTNGVGNVGQSFGFNMDQSNLRTGGAILGNSTYSWNWNFGDGGILSGGSTISHQYTKSGTYTLTLTIFNLSTGDQSTSSQTITVLPASITNVTLRLPFIADINDYSGNQLLTLAGGSGVPAFVTGVTGTAGTAMYLDGSANGPYVIVKDNNLLDGNTSASLALFVKKNIASAAGTVYVKQGVYSLAIASQGVSATLTNASNVTVNLTSATVSNNDTNWHHYALTYDGTTATLYFDGLAVATQSLSGSLAQNTASDLWVGKTISGNTFNGVLDTVRFYNVALKAADVQFLYNGSESINVNGTNITLGDVNNNGATNSLDASLVLQDALFLNPTGFYPEVATVSGDANPSAYDASLILEKSLGIILKYPADIAIQ